MISPYFRPFVGGENVGQFAQSATHRNLFERMNDRRFLLAGSFKPTYHALLGRKSQCGIALPRIFGPVGAPCAVEAVDHVILIKFAVHDDWQILSVASGTTRDRRGEKGTFRMFITVNEPCNNIITYFFEFVKTFSNFIHRVGRIKKFCRRS